MCLQKCHVICFLGGFNAIPWKSQTNVQSSLCRDWSLAIWIFVWVIFSTLKLADAGSISSVNISICLLWRLIGVKLYYHFFGCSFSKLCFSNICGRSEGSCENTSLWPWCLLRTLCGCWLSLAVYRQCFTEVSPAFLLSVFCCFLGMNVSKSKLENKFRFWFWCFWYLTVLYQSAWG